MSADRRHSPPGAQPYRYLRRLNGATALIDTRTIDLERTWLGQPVFAVWPNPSGWRGAFGVNVHIYRGLWVCSCWLEGRPGFHKHPLNTTCPHEVTFWEITEGEAREWFAENGQPLPVELISSTAAASPTELPPSPVEPAATPAELPPADRQADDADAPELVTLAQAAAMVHRTKRTLERYKTGGRLPGPAVDGGGGRPDLYDWKVMRPWLEAEFGIRLPKVFPANHRHA